jgi:hypothetical protein
MTGQASAIVLLPILITLGVLIAEVLAERWDRAHR